MNALVSESDLNGWLEEIARRSQLSLEVSNCTLRINSPTLLIGQKSLRDLNIKASVEKQRGYPLQVNGHTCICTFDPARVRCDDQARFCFFKDLEKFRSIVENGIPPYKDNITWARSQQEALSLRQSLLNSVPALLSCDIETFDDARKISCIGFATSDCHAVVFPLCHIPSPSDFFKPLLSLPLIGQNCFAFDQPVLRKVLGLNANFVYDTMFMAWQLEPELDKSLGFLGSIYTMKPYHKGMLKQARSGELLSSQEWLYNGIDCIRTFEIFNTISSKLQPGWQTIHDLNVSTAKACNSPDCFLTINKKALKLRCLEIQQQQSDLQAILDIENGQPFNPNSPKQVFDVIGKRGKLKTIDTQLHDELSRKNSQDRLVKLDLILHIRRLNSELKKLKLLKPDKTGRIHFSTNVVGGPNGEFVCKAPLNCKTTPFSSLCEDDLVVFNETPTYRYRLHLGYHCDNALECEEKLLKDGWCENSHGFRRTFHGRRSSKKTLEEFAEFQTISEEWFSLRQFILDSADSLQYIGILNDKVYFKTL